MQVQQTCKCGQKYWPSQKWIHEKCGVVNHQETVTTATNGPEVVVNAAPAVVVNRSKDRHKKTPERLEYIRQKMREYRKRG
jgi:hypothetical protein